MDHHRPRDCFSNARPTGDRQVVSIEDASVMLHGAFPSHRLAVPVVVLTAVGSPIYEHQR
jgi:hypothetical protein